MWSKPLIRQYYKPQIKGDIMKQNSLVRTLVAITTFGFLLVTIGCQCPCSSTCAKQEKNNEMEWNFDKTQLGSIPNNWEVAETDGKGTTAIWKVVADNSTPDKSHAVAVTQSKNQGHTFNLLIAEGTEYKDVEVEVDVKAMGGEEDQGGGPIWRMKDANNYYICRWNPLEDNFRLYYVKNGKRKQLSSADVKTDSKAWHKIEIEHKGQKIVAKFDDKKLIEIEDDTFQDAGMVGLWTKADATTAFDNFEVESPQSFF